MVAALLRRALHLRRVLPSPSRSPTLPAASAHRRLSAFTTSQQNTELPPPPQQAGVPQQAAGVPGAGPVAGELGGASRPFHGGGQHLRTPASARPPSSLKNPRWYMIRSNTSGPLTTHYEWRKAFPSFIRPSASYSTHASEQNPKQEGKDLSTTEHPFDDITYNIPEKPVTFTEGASYSLVILAGLGIAALAGYAVFKELIFEPKEYKIFGKALERIQSDSQVTVRIGHPITGYGQETRNRAARQRIPNKIWTDEDGSEHVEVNFLIRGPHGTGKVYSEMFKDNTDRTWKFTYLVVDIVSPQHAKTQLILESYLPLPA